MRLTYCITSITPRARYFSFLPWCVSEYKKKKYSHYAGRKLKPSIVMLEQLLTAACITHHDGEACVGGSLVGTKKAKTWWEQRRDLPLDLMSVQFTEKPALNAYFTSMVNLGFFKVGEDKANDEAHDGEPGEQDEEPASTFDDIELSPLGERVAHAYASAVGSLPVASDSGANSMTFSPASLLRFGSRGGLCEVRHDIAPDWQLLRDVFLSQVDTSSKSHPERRNSFLLILELARQLHQVGLSIDEHTFGEAVYYDEVVSDDVRTSIELPPALKDNALRWRMYYFHQYLSVALESSFAWLSTELIDVGVAGAKLSELCARLHDPLVTQELAVEMGIDITGSFGALTPKAFFDITGLSGTGLDSETAERFDAKLRSWQPCSEIALAELLRKKRLLRSPVGLALSLLVLATSLARFQQWKGTRYGNWFSNAAFDPYLDLIPPIVDRGLAAHFGNWWEIPFAELGQQVLTRYVVRQHVTLSYAKSAAADSCILQEEGERVIAHAAFSKFGVSNPRLSSAMRILEDLALLERDDEDRLRPSTDGLELLAQLDTLDLAA
jgi:hypothetical protein